MPVDIILLQDYPSLGYCVGMSHGADDWHGNTALANARSLLLATLANNKTFFAPRLAHVHRHLHQAVRDCRRRLHIEHEAHPQTIVQEDVLRLLGVRILLPANRQLSLLAVAIRQVLITQARLQAPAALRGGVQLLIDEIRQWLTAPAQVERAQGEGAQVDLLTLDTILTSLAERHHRCLRMLELRYFARLGMRDIALELGVPCGNIERELHFAKARLLMLFQEQVGH